MFTAHGCTRWIRAGIAALALVALAGCGSSKSDGAKATSAPDATTTTEAATTTSAKAAAADPCALVTKAEARPSSEPRSTRPPR